MAETKVIGNRAYKFFALGDTSAMSEKNLPEKSKIPKALIFQHFWDFYI